MFKIEQLAMTDTAEMQLKHPTDGFVIGEDEGTPVTFTVHGSASRQYRKQVDAMVRRNNQRGKRQATLEEARKENIEFLAALSIKVSNMEYKGKAIETQEDFIALYSDESLSWVREQVATFVGSVDGFLKQ